MVDFFLMLLCFSGFVWASIKGLRIKPANAPLFSISSIGVLLFLCSIFNHLQAGAYFLIVSGCVCSLFWIPLCLEKETENSRAPFFRMLSVFLTLAIVAFVLTHDMAFTVVDDFVYWGIMGKYLFINNHLPIAENPLDPRILAYTPGTSLIHYFFLVLTGKYSVHISYFAQNMMLISAISVVLDKENIKTSIVYMGALIILMTVFFGSIFTKLQVDYLLSMVCFSIFWIYYTETNRNVKLLTISMPICFLFLIKEIGFMLGLMIIAVVLMDIWVNSKIKWKYKLTPILAMLVTGAVLFILKKIWMGHVSAMGFVEFHNAINLESIKTTLHIFSDAQIQKGFLIFVKEGFIGSADRLNSPYLFWYTVIAVLWYGIVKKSLDKDKSRLFVFSGLVLVSFLLYLFLLYCLQVIIFKVGSVYDQTMGFSRYLNILFSPIVFIVVIAFFHTMGLAKKDIARKTVFTVTGIVIMVLGLSRVEVQLKQERQDIKIQEFSDQIGNRIDPQSTSIGFITGRNDNIANLQFLYHLLPNKVDLAINNTFLNQDDVIKYMRNHDYVLLYDPDPLILEWIQPYTEKQTCAGTIQFLKVLQDKSGGNLSKGFSLERVLL